MTEDNCESDCIRGMTLPDSGSVEIVARPDDGPGIELEGAGAAVGGVSGAITLFCASDSGEGACTPRTTDDV